jgi:hypothetical protein
LKALHLEARSADFGSLTPLSRASLVQLSSVLSPEKAIRLLCAFRLGALCGFDQPLCREADREVLAVALVDTRFRLIKKVKSLSAA